MLPSSSQLPAPGRLFLPGCAIAAGLLAVSSPVFAAPTGKARPKAALSKVALANPFPPMTLRVGKTATFPMPRLTTFTLESGAQNVFCEVKNGTLTVKALDKGDVRMRLNSPGQSAQVISLKLVEPKSPFVETRIISQVVERAPIEGAVPERDVVPPVNPPAETASATATDAGTTTTADAASTTAAPADTATATTATTETTAPTGTAPAVVTPPATTPLAVDTAPVPVVTDSTPVVGSNTSEQAPNANLGAVTTGGLGAVPNTVPDPITGAMPGMAMPSTATATATTPSFLSNDVTGTGALPAPPVPTLPALTAPVAQAPQISPVLPAPAPNKRASVNYRTTASLPQGIASTGRPGIAVTQGLARLLSFPSNILAVFFSDPNVMDARAINARTIAVTGVGPGPSTLAVFTSRYPGDAVGRANIYRISTTARSGATAPEKRDSRVVETAINAALGDPRVRTAVFTLPDGSLAARLSGTVRNESEVQAAVTTASFYVPRVISSLYADTNSPTLDAVMSGSYGAAPEADLQENLRRVTGNQTIELVPLPTGLGFKAEVDSAAEADSLLRVLPTLNKQIIPFIVVRGQPAGSVYNTTVPLLNGEDRQLTQKLHDVTGIGTVYAVRAASNSLACYGSVRTRTEYDAVRRYMLVMAQTAVPPAIQGTSQGGATLRPQGNEGGALASYDPSGGYSRNLGLQMFVRITDPGQSVIRKVTVETSVVEISRTSLKNLGAEYGSISVITETVTPGQVSNANGTTVQTGGVINRTLDTTFNQGNALAGNGFSGGAGLGFINPFRVRLNALVQSGEARVLSQPNVTSIEGAPAQITVGGERPVPKAVATQGAVGTQIEFRRYGVIISMRPTVTGDNTILLQIRADITQPDRTYEINLNGALIPGETVRSVDTTINVRPGDTVVMGGLITNEKRQTLSKLPILGDLPVIGKLFQSKRFDNNETELAIFMTPRIDNMPADMETLESAMRIPSFPVLPSRQESNSILFQETSRSN